MKTLRITSRRIGLGDAAAAVATPVARVLRRSCIDPVTGKLRPNSGCGRRARSLNRLVPNLNPFASKMPQPDHDHALY